MTALRNLGLDAGLNRHQLEHLASHTDVLRVPAGEMLFRAGHSSQQFIAVIDGYLDITTPSGHTRVAGPGTQIGAAELVDGHPHTATVSTRSAATLLVIFGPAYRSTIATTPKRSSRSLRHGCELSPVAPPRHRPGRSVTTAATAARAWREGGDG